MFGDLLSQAKEQQKAMHEKLAAITIEAEAGDGAVKVTANAAREILNIKFDKALLDWDDQEQVEDFVTVAVNRALALAAEKEAAESQNMIQNMIPPGLEGLFK
ncbi:MAG: YbaB/EbfC family nucleoid-associated protein [Saprospiraceae bacterium]|jgi:DNA-binding YbaB/EbfC family protein|nr:YbaB/EbfC family nucleoid-associated protein [Saprospiraceae bacterium]